MNGSKKTGEVGVSQGNWSAFAQFSDWFMVRKQGDVIWVNIISPWAAEGLGLYAHGHQVVNIFHLSGRFHTFETTQEMHIKHYYLGTSQRSQSRGYAARPGLRRPLRPQECITVICCMCKNASSWALPGLPIQSIWTGTQESAGS